VADDHLFRPVVAYESREGAADILDERGIDEFTDHTTHVVSLDHGMYGLG
jgi:hypothetical protein